MGNEQLIALNNLTKESCCKCIYTTFISVQSPVQYCHEVVIEKAGSLLGGYEWWGGFLAYLYTDVLT